MQETSEELVDRITGRRRPRRNRRSAWLRRMVAENHLSTDDLILPLFLIEGKNRSEEIDAMPGVKRYTVDQAVEVARKAADLAIPAIAPFPNVSIDKRDQTGSEITNADNLICQFVRAMKQSVPQVGVITDSALDPFTDHGHDGILRNGVIVNDESVERIVAGSLALADAGADIIAPSDMMDGRIGAIREALDKAGHREVAIMSYAAKFASGYYGPYREAIGTDELLQGDKKTYYVDPANADDAMREAELDTAEGADILMVKPGMPYLDIVLRMKEAFRLPVAVYQVSGEYAMIELASRAGVIDRNRVMMESLLAFKRGGADTILTYYALQAAERLQR